MSGRRWEKPEARAVRAVTREVRSAPPPEVDWDRVEEELIARVRREPLAARRSVWSRPLAPLGLAAAMVGALGVGLLHGGAWLGGSETDKTALAPLQVSPDPGHRAVLPTGLVAGQLLEAGDMAITHGEAERVSWTLAPHSKVCVVSAPTTGAQTGPLVLALVTGSIHAEVQHQDHGEVFAVDVGTTRVAVHGTSFSVERRDGRAFVEVFHGSVAVGPAGHPDSTQGWLMVGPDRASFSSDGARDAQWLAPVDAHVAQSKIVSAAPSSRAGRGPSSTHAKSLAAEGREPLAGNDPAQEALAPDATPDGLLTQIEIAPITEQILDSLKRCFEEGLSRGEESNVTVESSLTLSVAPQGFVREAVFNPPLSPKMMKCAEQIISHASFARAVGPTEVRVPVHLEK